MDGTFMDGFAMNFRRERGVEMGLHEMDLKMVKWGILHVMVRVGPTWLGSRQQKDSSMCRL